MCHAKYEPSSHELRVANLCESMNLRTYKIREDLILQGFLI